MESIDINVVRTLSEWRSADFSAVLATVVRTWGSSPRPVGAMMALCSDGRITGSVSGGCIEDDLAARYAGKNRNNSHEPLRLSGRPELVRYGINADEAHRYGLPCGGTLELLLEYDPDLKSLKALLESLAKGQLVQRVVSLLDGRVTLGKSNTPHDLVLNDRTMTCTIGPGYRMLLIGAGPLAEYLSMMALFNGFAVTVCDPRTEYTVNWPVQGVSLTSEMPDDVVTAFKPDQRSCVVALSHDPKLDDLALLEALHSKAFYVGAIGSRRNSAERRERMAMHFDETAESLAKLHGPAGLYIGSKTPAEIAVSIMAEILARKNGVCLAPETSVAVAKELVTRPGRL